MAAVVAVLVAAAAPLERAPVAAALALAVVAVVVEGVLAWAAVVLQPPVQTPLMLNLPNITVRIWPVAERTVVEIIRLLYCRQISLEILDRN